MTKLARSSANALSTFGKRDKTLKTSVPEDVKCDFERAARDSGFANGGEYLYEIIIRATYGQEMVRTLYERRMAALARIGPELEQS